MNIPLVGVNIEPEAVKSLMNLLTAKSCIISMSLGIYLHKNKQIAHDSLKIDGIKIVAEAILLSKQLVEFDLSNSMSAYSC